MQNLTPLRNPASSVKRAYRIWVLFIVSLSIFAALYSWTSWQNTKTDALRHATQLVDVGEKALNTYFAGLEVALALSSQDLLDAYGRMDQKAAQSRLSHLKNVHPDLLNANIATLDGVNVASSNLDAKLPVPVPDMAAFNRTIDEFSKGIKLSIGRPVVGLITKQWVIPLRYGIRDAAGNLRYVLIAPIPLSRPQSVWKDASLPEGMALGVVRDDGYLVSRYPVPVGLGLTDVYGKPRGGPFMNHLRDERFPVSGHVEAPSTLDGVSYLFVFRRLSGYPLSFFVTQPLSNVVPPGGATLSYRSF